MTVMVTSITPCERGAKVVFRLGNSLAEAMVIEEHLDEEGKFRGLNVDGERVRLALDSCGLWKGFVHDYWEYRDGRGRPLPWHYGDFPAEMVAGTSHGHSGTTA